MSDLRGSNSNAVRPEVSKVMKVSAVRDKQYGVNAYAVTTTTLIYANNLAEAVTVASDTILGRKARDGSESSAG